MHSVDRPLEERLLQEQEAEQDEEVLSFRPSRRSWKYGVLLWVVQLAFFMISLFLFIRAQSHCKCEDYMPIYSPALEALRETGHLQRFDGSFAKQNAFKGPPSPDIDAAWESITYQNGGVISISNETLHAVNASAAYSVELAPEIGGGFMASVEALHQLHCLNMLRQATYEDYYRDKPGPWEDSPQVLRYHLDHCIDNLRQKLMCDADPGILTYVWVKNHTNPFPDFSVQHKCRDFEALKNWVVKHQIYTTEEHGIERLTGYQELDVPP